MKVSGDEVSVTRLDGDAWIMNLTIPCCTGLTPQGDSRGSARHGHGVVQSLLFAVETALALRSPLLTPSLPITPRGGGGGLIGAGPWEG